MNKLQKLALRQIRELINEVKAPISVKPFNYISDLNADEAQGVWERDKVKAQELWDKTEKLKRAICEWTDALLSEE